MSRYIAFHGSIDGQNYTDYEWNFRIVKLSSTEIVFLQGTNKNGLNIALTDSKYDTKVAANNTGFCMNRAGMLRNTVDNSLTDTEKQYGSNKGGYYNSHGGREVMEDYDNGLPLELRRVISSTTLYSDNAGQGNITASAISTMNVGVYIPSQVEILGITTDINPYIANYISQWPWCAAGNFVNVRQALKDSDGCNWLLRDASTQYSLTDFRIIFSANKYAISSSAAWSYGLRPAFRIVK